MKFFNTAKIIIPIILLSYACTQHKKDNPIDSIKVETKDNSLLDKSKIDSTDLDLELNKDVLMWEVLNSYGSDTLEIKSIHFGNPKYSQHKTQQFVDSLLQLSPKHYNGNDLNKKQEKKLQIANNTNEGDLWEVKNSLISHVNLSENFYTFICRGSDMSSDDYTLLTYNKNGQKIDEIHLGDDAIEGNQVGYKFYPGYIKITDNSQTDLYDSDESQIYDITMTKLVKVNSKGYLNLVKTPESIVSKYTNDHGQLKHQKIVGTYKFGKDIEIENCGEILIKPCTKNSVYIYYSTTKAAPSYQTNFLLTEIKIEDNIGYYQDSLGYQKYKFDIKNDSIFVSGVGPFIKESNQAPKTYFQGNGILIPISKQVSSFKVNYY